MEASFTLDSFENLSLDALRTRRSAKWQTYPADVLPAWVAEMDFPLAPPIRETLLEAVEHDDCGYPYPGPLGEAFAAFAAARHGWLVDPGQVKLVPDVMSGITDLLDVLTGPGAEIVVNPPIYPPFFSAVRDIGRRVIEVPLAAGESGWTLDLDALERAFAAGAAAYLLCNPHNPTGRVFTREELCDVAELATRYRVLVLSDEIHAPLTLAGATHTPYVTVGEEAAAHSLTLASASKAWNIAGLKCALVVSGSATGEQLSSRMSPHLRYHSGHLGVVASVVAFIDGGPWLDGLLGQLDTQPSPARVAARERASRCPIRDARGGLSGLARLPRAWPR